MKAKTWLDYLSSDVYLRLAECRTKRSDLPELVNAKWRSYKEKEKDKNGFTKEDALIDVLELLDCNSIDFELTCDEYDELKK